MALPGQYRRILPSPPAIDFSSSEGKQLFSEALQFGNMEGFFKLSAHFQTQSEPAFCGLASLTMVLNALAIDPGRKWKGPWRWYDEFMLDCCEPLEKIKNEGVTFGKVVCLAQCAGADVEAYRTNESTFEGFRDQIIKCTSSEDCHLIASYHRKPLGQTGTGHFSPIGGYHVGRDMVLVLDVARFKYPPHWVPLSLLWEAMDTIDEATGRPRGFMLVSSFKKAPSLLYTLSCKHESWVSIAKYFSDVVPALLKSEDVSSIPQIIIVLLKFLPASAGEFIKWVAEVRRHIQKGSSLTGEERGQLSMKEEILLKVRQTELYRSVTDYLLSSALSCPNFSSRGIDSLQEIAAACWKGTTLLSESLMSDTGCCKETCIKCLKITGDSPKTVISSTMVSGGNKQEVDVLVSIPTAITESCCTCSSNNCILVHPASNDLLTILLLALPSICSSNVKDKNLLSEVHRLTENLPDLLQQEVLHLRRQLYYLKRCRDGE